MFDDGGDGGQNLSAALICVALRDSKGIDGCGLK